MTHKDFRADIHCHSHFSDGSDSPFELLLLAKEKNLQGLSITDHDTVDAYSPALFEEAKKMGIELLTGVEISSEWGEFLVHILGYGFQIEHEGFLTFLKGIQQRREERNRMILKKLAAKKIHIQEEELKNSSVDKIIGRPHIAALMVQKGYVADIKGAFDHYLKEGACCYISCFKSPPVEVIQKIHEASGKAILAHPHFIKKKRFLRNLLALPFDGIECYYAKLDSALELPWLKIAKEKSWIATGGSDYHGIFKPHLSLGDSWVGKSTFDALRG